MKGLIALIVLTLGTMFIPPAYSQEDGSIFTGYDKNGYPIDTPIGGSLGEMSAPMDLALIDGADAGAGLAANSDLVRTKIAQWGDPLTPPQTRTRCIGYASGKWPWPAKGGWKTCNEWATDYKTMQVSAYIKSVSSKQIERAAVAAVKKAVTTCVGAATAAATAALFATPSPEPAARMAAAYTAGQVVFKACMTDQAGKRALAGFAADAFDLAFDFESHWSDWSGGNP
jgi:hypothetical protein